MYPLHVIPQLIQILDVPIANFADHEGRLICGIWILSGFHARCNASGNFRRGCHRCRIEGLMRCRCGRRRRTRLTWYGCNWDTWLLLIVFPVDSLLQILQTGHVSGCGRGKAATHATHCHGVGGIGIWLATQNCSLRCFVGDAVGTTTTSLVAHRGGNCGVSLLSSCWENLR